LLNFIKKSPINYAIAKFSGDPVFTSIFIAILLSLIIETVLISFKKDSFDKKTPRVIGYSLIMLVLILANMTMYFIRN
jgi:hypothetical protein